MRGQALPESPLSQGHATLSVRVHRGTFTGHPSITLQPKVQPLPPSLVMLAVLSLPLGPKASGRG